MLLNNIEWLSIPLIRATVLIRGQIKWNSVHLCGIPSEFIYLFCVFSSTTSSLVLLCSGVYKYRCPEKKTQPLYDTAQQQVRLTNSTDNSILFY